MVDALFPNKSSWESLLIQVSFFTLQPQHTDVCPLFSSSPYNYTSEYTFTCRLVKASSRKLNPTEKPKQGNSRKHHWVHLLAMLCACLSASLWDDCYHLFLTKPSPRAENGTVNHDVQATQNFLLTDHRKCLFKPLRYTAEEWSF